MLKKIMTAGLTAAVMVAILVGSSWAAIPQKINIQGVVTPKSGAPISFPFTTDVAVGIYSDEGGTALVKEYLVSKITIDEKGFFNIPIDIDNSFTPFDQPYYVKIILGKLGVFPENGTQPLLSVPYSLRAQVAEGLPGVTVKSGNVGIGTTSPWGKLHTEDTSNYGVSLYTRGARGVLGINKDSPIDINGNGIYGLLGGKRLQPGADWGTQLLGNGNVGGVYGQINYNNFGYLGYNHSSFGENGVYGYSQAGTAVMAFTASGTAIRAESTTGTAINISKGTIKVNSVNQTVVLTGFDLNPPVTTTINAAAGTVTNTGGTSGFVKVLNSYVTANSIILATPQTGYWSTSTQLCVKDILAGSFKLFVPVPAAANGKVAFLVIN
ncbi:MAG: hypothetical protein WC903_00480 [Candidatus Margulisiibacteriota bacterium]